MLDALVYSFYLFSLKCHKTRSISLSRSLQDRLPQFCFYSAYNVASCSETISIYLTVINWPLDTCHHRRLTRRLSTLLDQLPRVTYFSPQHVACVFVRDCWQSSFLSWRLWMKILMDTDSAPHPLFTSRYVEKNIFVPALPIRSTSNQKFFPSLRA